MGLGQLLKRAFGAIFLLRRIRKGDRLRWRVKGGFKSGSWRCLPIGTQRLRAFFGRDLCWGPYWTPLFWENSHLNLWNSHLNVLMSHARAADAYKTARYTIDLLQRLRSRIYQSDLQCIAIRGNQVKLPCKDRFSTTTLHYLVSLSRLSLLAGTPIIRIRNPLRAWTA